MTVSGEGRQRRRLGASEVDLSVVRQKALLVGTTVGGQSVAEAETSLEELARLTETAGADVVGTEFQRLDKPTPATYVGKGKAAELAELAMALDVDLVVFDDELSPAQQRNLEALFGRDVIDRVALILDIFAQHAHSQDGMLQVELAQLRYRLPRLRGRGVEMSRLGGGIGTRGPGETQLEVDRRRIQRRISRLGRDLEGLAATRATQTKARSRSGIATVALVGYTNAGKSTLLNTISDSDALVENRLFSTLDPTTRRLRLPGGGMVLASDTVGFVRRLPHQLVDAFRSTLDEVSRADLLVHVVDISAHDREAQYASVRQTLAEIGAGALPELLVGNKCDLASSDDLDDFSYRHPDAGAISAMNREGIERLIATISEQLRGLNEIYELVVPHDRGDVVAAIHRSGDVIVEVHDGVGTRLQVRLSDSAKDSFSEFMTANSATGKVLT